MAFSQKYRYQYKLSLGCDRCMRYSPSNINESGVYFEFNIKYMLKRRPIIGEGRGDVETELGSTAASFFVKRHLITTPGEHTQKFIKRFKVPEYRRDRLRRYIISRDSCLYTYFGHHGIRDDDVRIQLIQQIEDLTKQNLNSSRPKISMILSIQVFTVQQADELMCEARNRAITPDPREVNRADLLIARINQRPLALPRKKIKVRRDNLERQRKEEDCCICLNTLCGQGILWLPCSHAYHSECIIQWAKTSDKCPLCRIPMGLLK